MASKRVLVLYEPGRSGAAALDLAGGVARGDQAEVTIVRVAPDVAGGVRCGPSARDYDAAVLDAVRGDLAHARARLATEPGVRCELLLEGHPPSLAQLAAGGGYDLVLLPARHRRLGGGHPAARGLRQATAAEIRVVG